MSKGVNLFVKKANARKIKAFPELNALGISWGASLLLAVILLISDWNPSLEYVLLGSVDIMGMFRFGGSFYGAMAYLAPAVLGFVLERATRKAIIKGGAIPLWVRRAGIALIPFALVGNIFAAIAGFMTAKKNRTVEYNLLSYALISSVFVIAVSALNLFKPQLSDKFWLGIGLLCATIVIYLAAMIPIVRGKAEPKKLVPLAWVMIATALTGNLFALILGMVIIAKVRNAGSNKTIEWVDTVRRIFRNYMAVLGMFIIIFLIGISVCSYFTFDYSLAVSNDYGNLLQPPGMAYPFGTDHLGRCVFTRIVFGARISLAVGIISTAIPLLVGGLLGAMAGHYSNRLDNIIMRVLDVLNAVPGILMAMAVMAAFGSSIPNMVIALSISNIPVYARTMRAQVMVVSQSEFVEAARACGRREYETLIRHIVPNSLAPMIVRASVSIGIAVLSTSSLSYLGLGIGPHIPEWGNILKVGSSYLETHPYLAIYPGVFIIILVLAFNFLGDGLRDALDPKLK